jgi:hypothetical protein
LLAALLVFGCADSRITAGRHSSTAPSNAHPHKQVGPKLPRCPRDAANCSAARGTILYVEAVDPDGDGDAHFVLTSDQSITFPGISVIDVKKSLRPHPLPGVGERIAAAGPVYRGSHGQRQIEATVLRVAGQR